MATMIKCTDKATFQYLMDYYKLSKMPIYHKRTFLGHVTRDMEYIKGLSNFTYTPVAIHLAFEQIGSVIDVMSNLNTTYTINYIKKECKLVYAYDDGSGYVSHHTYPKAIETSEVISATETLDKLFEQFYKLNRTYKNRNDVWYEFEDEEIKHKYLIWLNMLDNSRSFSLYYGDGIVD